MDKIIFLKSNNVWMIGKGSYSSITKMFDGTILYVHSFHIMRHFCNENFVVSLEYDIVVEISSEKQMSIIDDYIKEEYKNGFFSEVPSNDRKKMERNFDGALNLIKQNFIK